MLSNIAKSQPIALANGMRNAYNTTDMPVIRNEITGIHNTHLFFGNLLLKNITESAAIPQDTPQNTVKNSPNHIYMLLPSI